MERPRSIYELHSLKREQNRQRVKSEEGLSMQQVVRTNVKLGELEFQRRRNMNRPKKDGKK